MVYKIYISSRDDNDEYLVATQRALFSINEIAISAAMTDDIPVLGEKRQAAARMMIREARVFVGLYDANYGSVPEGETRSHEELEYQYAIDMNKSMLIFVMDDAIHNADDRQKQFLEHIMKNHVVTTFSDAEDLAAKIKVALASYRETEKHRRTLRPPVSSFRESLPSLPGQPSQEQEQESEEDFEEQVARAIEIAESNLEQIVRRALELHDAQRQVVNEPGEDYDNKITVQPLWGEPIRRSQFQSDIFMVMPFREKYNAVFEQVIRPVAAGLNLTIKRGDEFTSTRGSIMQEVWAALNACKLVIVETTEINANVYYELGIAHTLGKPVILITQTKEVEELPFDVRHLRFLVYEDTADGMKALDAMLKKSIIWLMNDIQEQLPEE